MQESKQNVKVQKGIVLLSLILFAVKIFAWYITNSIAVLTDALESIVNVAASFIGLYSLSVSAKPRDTDHPYGHGKIEYISAAIEGTLIFVAGIVIIFESVSAIFQPKEIHKIDFGIWLLAATAFINYGAGYICVRTGKKNHSMALMASGRHLQTDTITTVGIIIGLLLVYFTHLNYIDIIVALIFAFVILRTGYKIIKSSVAGMMDAADEELLQKMVILLNENRETNWIDLHNMRIIKYGAILHLDFHLTVPWYFNVLEAHHEIDKLSNLIKNEYGESVEMFVHSDACLDFSCRICSKFECTVRQHPFERKIKWTLKNIRSNNKHKLETEIE